jgi:phosphate transport system protein
MREAPAKERGMETRRSYREALESVAQEVLAMGVRVEEALRTAVESLTSRDSELARRVITGDLAINGMESVIEDRVVSLIATEQPVATDLRRLVTGLKVVTQIERMGDHAVHVAKATLHLAAEPEIDVPEGIPTMARMGISMLERALEGFVHNDSGSNAALADMDVEVDALRKRVARELEDRMRRSPESVRQSVELLLVARFLERVADHATNIGEWISYGETARKTELNP